MAKFPFKHVVLEDRKEVWIKGSYPGVMAIAKLMDKYYPDYRPMLAKSEFLDDLKRDPSIRDQLDI